MDNELRALRVANRAQDIVTRDLKTLAREAATYLTDLRKVLQKGTPEQKKRFVRDFVGDVVVDGEKQEVQVGFYDYGAVKGKKGTLKTLQALAAKRNSEDVSLWLVPPTGFEPVLRA